MKFLLNTDFEIEFPRIQFLPVSCCWASSYWCLCWLFCRFLLFSCTSRCRFRRHCRWCWSDGCRCRSGSQSRDGGWSLSHSCCGRGSNGCSAGRSWLLSCSWCWCGHCFGLNTLKGKINYDKILHIDISNYTIPLQDATNIALITTCNLKIIL